MVHAVAAEERPDHVNDYVGHVKDRLYALGGDDEVCPLVMIVVKPEGRYEYTKYRPVCVVQTQDCHRSG